MDVPERLDAMMEAAGRAVGVRPGGKSAGSA